MNTGSHVQIFLLLVGAAIFILLSIYSAKMWRTDAAVGAVGAVAAVTTTVDF